MNLYVDESGNTGETLSEGYKFNFIDQPFYALAGILPGKKDQELVQFLQSLKVRFGIQANELKAKNIYDTKSRLIVDLIAFIIENRIPYFIEIMDKIYYLNVQIATHFIVPVRSIDNDIIRMQTHIASILSDHLSHNIYESFIKTCKAYTHEALESFFEELIEYFDTIEIYDLKGYVQITRNSYYEYKALDPLKALQKTLPIPDLSPKKKLYHLLPNFGAFTGLIGRVQKHKFLYRIQEVKMIHDEQKQFDSIYMDALDSMKKVNNNNDLIENLDINERVSLNLDDSISLEFSDSITYPQIQASDLLAGFVSRFWNDFLLRDSDKMEKYSKSMKSLTYNDIPPSVGINFFVPDGDYDRFSGLMSL